MLSIPFNHIYYVLTNKGPVLCISNYDDTAVRTYDEFIDKKGSHSISGCRGSKHVTIDDSKCSLKSAEPILKKFYHGSGAEFETLDGLAEFHDFFKNNFVYNAKKDIESYLDF